MNPILLERLPHRTVTTVCIRPGRQGEAGSLVCWEPLFAGSAVSVCRIGDRGVILR